MLFLCLASCRSDPARLSSSYQSAATSLNKHRELSVARAVSLCTSFPEAGLRHFATKVPCRQDQVSLQLCFLRRACLSTLCEIASSTVARRNSTRQRFREPGRSTGGSRLLTEHPFFRSACFPGTYVCGPGSSWDTAVRHRHDSAPTRAGDESLRLSEYRKNTPHGVRCSARAFQAPIKDGPGLDHLLSLLPVDCFRLAHLRQPPRPPQRTGDRTPPCGSPRSPRRDLLTLDVCSAPSGARLSCA